MKLFGNQRPKTHTRFETGLQPLEDLKLPDQLGKAHTKRYQGLKYFNKVGYTDKNKKPIPRWATDMELINKVIAVQKKNMDPDEVFGKIDPRVLSFEHSMFFGGEGLSNLRKERKFNNRGSSANWNDVLEFATPKPEAPAVSMFSQGMPKFQRLGEKANLLQGSMRSRIYQGTPSISCISHVPILEEDSFSA